MSLHISIIGIDGSGKSTLAAALADIIAAELGVVTASVGDDLRGKTPQEDLYLPGFAPDGVPAAARLGRLFRRGARAATGYRRLYPPLKLSQLAAQERTARTIAGRYQPDVIFSDGNLILSAAGRAVNYMDACAERNLSTADPLAVVEALFDHVIDDRPLATTIARSTPGLALMRGLRRLDRWLRLGLMELPDALIFLDIAPETALARLAAKGAPLDRHENIHDLAAARTMYRSVAELFRRRCGDQRVAVIDVTALSLGEVIRRAVAFVRTLPLHSQYAAPARTRLGTTEQELSRGSAVLKKVLSYRYLVRYALPNLHRGSALELTFPLSSLGRQLLREGYSAGMMRAIYLQEGRRYGLLDRVCLAYPLHRAVYHRLQILRRAIEHELCRRLGQVPDSGALKILTAPSGYAFDLFQPLGRLASMGRGTHLPLHILASDLDPDGQIEAALRRVGDDAGIDLAFLRGDLTLDETQEQLVSAGPYDIVLFVGLSCWIAKPHLLRHLRLVRERLLAPGGTLFTDCFTPHAFALSGKYAGYQANYYAPREFTSILAYCGFDPARMHWESGPEGVNHVCVARV